MQIVDDIQVCSRLEVSMCVYHLRLPELKKSRDEHNQYVVDQEVLDRFHDQVRQHQSYMGELWSF